MASETRTAGVVAASPVSRSIDPAIRDYLQARVREWLAGEGRTGKDLAKLAGVSRAQISDALNKGQIGWRTMVGLSSVFGMGLGEMEAAAKQWASEHPGATPRPPRRVLPRLVDRPEWASVATAAAEEHAELDPGDIAAAGQIPDDPEQTFEGPLDVPTVAGLATLLRARRVRLARRKQ